MSYIKIKSKNMECWCDGYRVDNSRGIVYLSLLGPRNAVLSAWARLHRSKRATGYLELETETSIRLPDDGEFVSVQSNLPEGNLHLVLLDVRATHRVSPFGHCFFQIGPSPETRYFSRLNRSCVVPFRSDWSSTLWEAGLREKLIVPLEGFGAPAYSIDTGNENFEEARRLARCKSRHGQQEEKPKEPPENPWAKVVREGLLSGRIPGYLGNATPDNVVYMGA